MHTEFIAQEQCKTLHVKLVIMSKETINDKCYRCKNGKKFDFFNSINGIYD